MIKRRYSIIFGLVALFVFVLASSSSFAEFDRTRKMKAKAQYYFDKGEYYRAIDIWAEVLKVDSHDREALRGISTAQEVIEKSRGEKEKVQGRRLKELIQKGKNYHRDREYKEALSCWGRALSIDPTNKEVLDLIEETRIKAQYQISILDRLDREKRLKTPYINDLDKIANKMINLLEKADVKVKKEKREKIEKEAKIETAAKAEKEEEFIKTAFDKGKKFYKKGRFKKAISEWNKILRYLPKSSEIAIKIAELKERIAAEEKPQKRRIKEDKGLIGERKEKADGKRFLSGWNLLIIAAVVLLFLFFIIKLTVRAAGSPFLAKAFVKKARKKEKFEPRDLKKFLKRKGKEDKDLFK